MGEERENKRDRKEKRSHRDKDRDRKEHKESHRDRDKDREEGRDRHRDRDREKSRDREDRHRSSRHEGRCAAAHTHPAAADTLRASCVRACARNASSRPSLCVCHRSRGDREPAAPDAKSKSPAAADGKRKADQASAEACPAKRPKIEPKLEEREPAAPAESEAELPPQVCPWLHGSEQLQLGKQLRPTAVAEGQVSGPQHCTALGKQRAPSAWHLQVTLLI